MVRQRNGIHAHTRRTRPCCRKATTVGRRQYAEGGFWKRIPKTSHLATRYGRNQTDITIVHALPKEEMFGLASQMRRCAVSIPSNIAEGSKRGKKEFAQFLRIANGSAAELETQLLLAEELYGLDTNPIIVELTALQKMIESLLRKI